MANCFFGFYLTILKIIYYNILYYSLFEDNKIALFESPCKPNVEGLISNLKPEGTPDRVFHMELFLYQEIHEAVRERVRDTLDICMPGRGYCLGSGNSVANYIPLDNYLTMVDEGRKYSG